jgi:NAD(P)-dependent dehydrogenase (short-subunit alcohol dehydrogenase family)
MRSVIITGANRGIGFATAIAFAKAGYKVFATTRNKENAKELKALSEEGSLDIEICKMDVDNDASVEECIGGILKEHGSVDVLVNNAGIERNGSIEELSMEDFKAVMETNYFGALRCIKMVLPSMRENRNGSIINITSIAGRIANTPLGAYAASKFALEGLSESLAQEVKPFNIRVSVIEPGIINTDMANSISHRGNSIYMQPNRFGGLFIASLKSPTPSTLVADKIVEVAEDNGGILRHPIGPDALPFIQWRNSMSDEEWINWNAADDEVWYDSVQELFGLNARP